RRFSDSAAASAHHRKHAVAHLHRAQAPLPGSDRRASLEGVRGQRLRITDGPVARAAMRHARPRPDDLTALSADDLVDAYRCKALSPVEVVSAVLERIQLLNHRINAFAWLDADAALLSARESE